ncbi:MAG: hypothetical protein ACI8P3_004303, partial [Saprospiraceae bacterium]
FDVGTITTITYTATDECSNQKTCSFTVTVDAVDNGSITLDCPNNITVTAEAGQSGATISWAAPISSTSCPSGGLFINQTGGQTNGSFFPEGTYQIVYEAGDACNNIASCSFSITVLPESTGGDYCESESDFPYHDYIGGVQLNTLNNPSGKSKYSDFTAISTDLSIGIPYDLILTTAYSWTTYNESWKVWIDYNQNGIFEEPAEIAFSGTTIAPPNGTDFATLNGVITAPAGALTGATRMRVSMKRGNVMPEPCEILPFGEVEDYTINILGSNNTGLLGNDNTPNVTDRYENTNDLDDERREAITLYPNPTKRHLYLEAPKFAGLQVTISIYNHMGRLVKSIEKEAFPADVALRIDLKNQINGFYYIAIKAKDRKLVTKKFVIEDMR